MWNKGNCETKGDRQKKVQRSRRKTKGKQGFSEENNRELRKQKGIDVL